MREVDYNERLQFQKEIERLRQNSIILQESISNLREENKSLKNQIGQITNEVENRLWDVILREISHSIFSDIFVAVNNLNRGLMRGDSKVETAISHITHIKDFIHFYRKFAKYNEGLPVQPDTTININTMVKEVLTLIQNSITTLALSEDEHEDKLKELKIPINEAGKPDIKINKNFVLPLRFILVELIGNACKYSNPQNPVIEIKIENTRNQSIIMVANNNAINAEVANWLSNKSDIFPEQISTYKKSGLFLAKKWSSLIGLEIKIKPDYKNNKSETTIIL